MNAASSTDEVLNAARGLHVILTELSHALETARLPEILDAEPRLAAALDALTVAHDGIRAGAVVPADTTLVRAELQGALTSMKRCAVLGAVLDDIVRCRCAPLYDASGGTVPIPVRGAFAERA